MSVQVPWVWLFDMDGVLLAPRGYRRATVATVQHWARRLGLAPPWPTEDDMAAYEAHGITSEWDMAPLMLAAVLEAALAQGWRPPSQWPALDARPVSRFRQHRVAQVDYRGPARAVAATRPPEVYPAAHAWALQRSAQPVFPRLQAYPALAEALFAHSRDARRSPVTAVFQHYVLGDEAYARTYGRPAAFASASFLLEHDEPLPSADWRAAVYRAWQQGAWTVAVMTARPSRPADAAGDYAPEAEMALQRIGWPDVPHIGYGHVRAWRADGEGYLKPHPAHALAALYAAWHRQADTALDWALAVLANPRHARATLPRAIGLTVVEDSPPGLRAARAAAQVLQAGGVQVRLSLVGVAQAAVKQRALRALGARVAPSVDAAVARGWLPAA